VKGIAAKIIAPSELTGRSTSLPRPLILTNGVFDVLHRGHVTYLEAARRLGTSLLVAVNSDASARSLGKGPGRPINSEQDRLYVLAALESVTHVTLFEESTPCELIRLIRPDVYVKGGDYDIETLEEARIVRSWGGSIQAIPFIDGYSTSALVKRIRGL
jgi:rfaE bifunctional protein nucleotidyltransferase chain/domain